MCMRKSVPCLHWSWVLTWMLWKLSCFTWEMDLMLPKFRQSVDSICWIWNVSLRVRLSLIHLLKSNLKRLGHSREDLEILPWFWNRVERFFKSKRNIQRVVVLIQECKSMVVICMIWDWKCKQFRKFTLNFLWSKQLLQATWTWFEGRKITDSWKLVQNRVKIWRPKLNWTSCSKTSSKSQKALTNQAYWNKRSWRWSGGRRRLGRVLWFHISRGQEWRIELEEDTNTCI